MLPDAEIVHDRFHLIKYLNDVIDKVRRREVKQHEELKESRYALLKNQENLTEKQRLKFEAIRDANYQVSKVWQIRENFKALFASDIASGFILYRRWVTDSLGKQVKEMNRVIEMFNNHMKGVINALTMNFRSAILFFSWRA